jgi:hypothetical protein
MKRPKYYVTKAKLSGVFSEAPKGFAALVIATALFLFAQGNLTPSSVSVSGYTRADGTRVASYYRRPPGSVAHDRPYQALNLVAILGIGIGGFFTGRPIRRFFVAPPEALVPIPKNSPPRPSLPIRIPNLPHSAKARKNWKCLGCEKTIASGDVYHYSAVDVRQRFCGSCATVLTTRRAQWRKPTACIRTSVD